ncbi:4Fe-4S dicluster domain-containing protein [uncultured Paludibaculum sp.]|uniref:4Fe-4S dicluster domain-containing protein n=1 Tax=uncultured Paludibaculum sp. TaxID=1765020 RepID=UPI002AABED44|nr:4Fe-4S dicluster domain-containing protein [uncultured Paludibaculum sp.]
MRRSFYRLDCSDLDTLLEQLKKRGYSIFGPRILGNAIQWKPIDSLADLPKGHSVQLAPAQYRLQATQDEGLFQYPGALNSLKSIFHPPRQTITTIQKTNGDLDFHQEKPEAAKRAFLGVSACDLTALAALDKVLLGSGEVDEFYRANRADAFLIAVHCTQSAPTCFCASVAAGPRARTGYDIALTERITDDSHGFLAEAGSSLGTEMLEESNARPAPPEWIRQSTDATHRAAAAQTRAVNLPIARPVIESTFEHPRWEDTARRCLSCGNCTSVCPTCFCVNYEEHSSLDLTQAQRIRVWDSCFTHSFSYIHGGSIRLTPKSRYRQWLSHKLARWQDQFGVTGCVGCGRCIVWCPAGIDITEEFGVLEQAAAAVPVAGGTPHGH